eukprot:sb/3461785/
MLKSFWQGTRYLGDWLSANQGPVFPDSGELGQRSRALCPNYPYNLMNSCAMQHGMLDKHSILHTMHTMFHVVETCVTRSETFKQPIRTHKSTVNPRNPGHLSRCPVRFGPVRSFFHVSDPGPVRSFFYVSDPGPGPVRSRIPRPVGENGLPEGWERVDSKSGVYFWHIPSGTTQYQHPSLSSNLDLLSEQVSNLQLSKPETEDDRKATFQSDPDLPGPDIPEPRFTGRINFPRYRKLTVFHPDIPGTPIYRVLFSLRNFAYVVRQKHSSSYRCFVLHCTTCAASHLAIRLQDICKLASAQKQNIVLCDLTDMESDNESEGSDPTQLISDEIVNLASKFSVTVGGHALSYDSVMYKIEKKDLIFGTCGDPRMEKQNKKKLLELLEEMSRFLFYNCFPVFDTLNQRVKMTNDEKLVKIAELEKELQTHQKDVIQLQKKVIQLQDKELSAAKAVAQTVEREMKSFSSVVSSNCAAAMAPSRLQAVIKRAAAEPHKKEEEPDRSRNIIFYNVDEEDGEQDTPETAKVMSEQSLTPSDDLPDPKRFDTLYLGYIRVEKEKVLGDIDTWCDPHTQVSAQPKKGSCLSRALAHDPLDRFTSRFLSVNRKWVKIIWLPRVSALRPCDLEDIGRYVDEISISNFGCLAAPTQYERGLVSRRLCVGIALGGYVAKSSSMRDRTLLAEHRVRFISFMALGTDESFLGYIVHGGPKIFYCHVYQNDGSCAEVARAIQDACTVRYQLLLAKQEEMKRLEKPEPQGVSGPIRTRYLGHVTGYQPIRDQESVFPDFSTFAWLDCVSGAPKGMVRTYNNSTSSLSLTKYVPPSGVPCEEERVYSFLIFGLLMKSRTWFCISIQHYCCTDRALNMSDSAKRPSDSPTPGYVLYTRVLCGIFGAGFGIPCAALFTRVLWSSAIEMLTIASRALYNTLSPYILYERVC